MKIINPKIVKQAIELFDLDIRTLRLLGGEDGDVYEAHKEGQAFILKLVPTTAEKNDVLAEKINFAHYLSDNGVNIACWLPSINDKLIETITVDDIVVTATKVMKIPGQHPNMRDSRMWNAGLFYQWGQVLGQMHRLAQVYTGGEHIGQWHDEVAFFINWCSDPDVKPRWLAMKAYLETLPQPSDAYGLIHNDLHQWNFMLDQGKITVFDFDVCGHHWFLTDIGIALFHGLWVDSWHNPQAMKNRNQRLYDRFMAGYETENHLDAEWRARLPNFLKYRQLLSFTVFSDPQNPASANKRQRQWVAAMRRGIVEDIPVLDIRF